MRSSRRTYLLVKVAIPAALGNFLINAALGAAIFPPGHDVPLFGGLSVSLDTLAGSFLIGFLTVAGGAPAARREARSGRVPGFGRRAPWLAWAQRHPLWTALGCGALCVVLVGLPVMQAMRASGVLALKRDAFVAFKATYAGITGLVWGIVAALLGLGAEEDVSGDARWCVDPSAPLGGPIYPFDPLDKVMLAVSSGKRPCSATLTWELRGRGTIDPDHVQRALADLVARYPSLGTRVQSIDGVPPVARKYRYAFDPAFRPERILEVVDARGDPARLASLTRDLRNRSIDLFAEPPMALTLAIGDRDSFRLIFRHHRAIADARAFIGLLVDFAGFLEAARAGRRPCAAALVPIARRRARETVGLSALRRALWCVSGFGSLLTSMARGALRPVTPLRQNDSNDHSGENGTVYWAVGDPVLEAWSGVQERLGVDLDTLLAAALVLANQRWHQTRQLPLGRSVIVLFVEARPPEGFVSFANHFASIGVEADLGRPLDPMALLRSVQTQVAGQRDRRTPEKRLLGDGALVASFPLEWIQKLMLETTRPAENMSLSNAIAFDFPPLGGDCWSIDDVLLTVPPLPRHGIALSAIRYRGRLVFGFDYKSSAATREQAEELRAELRGALREMTGTEGETVEVSA